MAYRTTVPRAVLVVAAMAVAFLVADQLQPIVISCYSHGEPNCNRLDELHEAALAKRSLLVPMFASVVAGVLSFALLRDRSSHRS